MKHKKSVLGVVLSKLGGLLVFLILIGIANLVYFPNITFVRVVQFLDNNLGLIILYSIIFFFAELFSILVFPFNLLYPIFNAVGSAFLVSFLFKMYFMIESLVGIGEVEPLRVLYFVVIPLVFFIVLVVGYVNVFKNIGSEKHTEKPVKKMKDKKKVEWNEVGEEFKLMIYDLIRKAREAINKK